MASGNAPFGSSPESVYVDQQMSGNFGQPNNADQQPVISPNYKFTQEEIRTLKECNRESFFFRCLPIGTVLGSSTYFAVRAGYLKPSVKYGAGPKMLGASIIGYFIGKVSYQQKCVEKLMALPNSAVGELLRQKKGRLGFQETMSMEPGFQASVPIATPAFPTGRHSDTESSLFTDVGDVRPLNSFDNESTQLDYGKSSYDTTEEMLNYDPPPQKTPQYTTSYEELRKQNREEYDQRSRQSGLASLSEPTGGSPRRYSQHQAAPKDNQQSIAPKVKNIYGDVWDDKPE